MSCWMALLIQRLSWASVKTVKEVSPRKLRQAVRRVERVVMGMKRNESGEWKEEISRLVD